MMVKNAQTKDVLMWMLGYKPSETEHKTANILTVGGWDWMQMEFNGFIITVNI